MTAYRCTNTNHGQRYNATGGLYESVTKDGELETENGLTRQSTVTEVCASKSPEAAVFGAIQARQASGEYFVYLTHETPDIDLSGASGRDFAILEEVRFRTDSFVEFQLVKSVFIPREIVVSIQESYKLRLDEASAQTIKSKLSHLINS